MKRLTLVRHAKSSWSDRAATDHDRKLSGRGKRDAPRMGRRLRARGVKPSLILSSTAERALATARIIAFELGLPRDFPTTEPALYHAWPYTILDIVQRQDDACSDLMLVGHNPGFTEFANALAPDFRIDNLPTAGIVAVELDVETWPEADAGSARFVFYDYPKNPAAIPGAD